jgi:ABC-type nitrate/sulfonate/bicarbonate transport system substrate-binding protein
MSAFLYAVHRMTEVMSYRAAISFIISIFIIILLTSAGTSTAQHKEVAPINISYASTSGIRVPLWIAKEMHLYEKYGLDARVIHIPSGNVASSALITGEIDVISGSGSASVAAADRGLPIVIVGSFGSTIYKLVANPGISSVKDLKGKIAGTSRPGSTTDFALRRALLKLGLVPDKDVKILPTGIGEADKRLLLMVQGRMDATLASPESIYSAETQGGVKLEILADLEELGIYNTVGDLSTRRDLLKSKRDRLQAFFMAISEAIWIGKKSKESALKVISKYMRTYDPKRLDLIYEASLARMSAKPYAREEAIQMELENMAFAEPRFKDKKASEFLDNSILSELEKTGFFDRLHR